MGFVILPALVPDISAVYDVYFAAFKDNALTRALFPSATEKDLTDANSEFRQAHTAHVTEYWKTSATQYTFKCIDTETNKIVGMALCDVYITPSDWKKGEIGWLDGKERERAEALVKPLWDTREKLWLNERYIYCHVMAVHPDYQRKGIGELLFKRETTISQQTGLPMYIESSKEGVKLYERMGSRRLKEKLVKSNETNGAGENEECPLYVWLPEGGEKRLPKSVELA
ncbi:acyl-n-acyltransferase [Alternaria burnsii]|uniref:Acyl-n-acyltransferase n=1 Tax=Alternaria burnsii TaxID=1187904 RepID=A0A8H7B2V1_9PLEO|nr:acyl-n-acyltransferase [Alternaria burnsii]KAF7673581.1 acyl-n-acyltransferase [Alternaria burnsii]CAI9637391.1 unnamed protein product [Alternaria burnsii]